MGGQFIVVMPDQDAVFVSTANTLKFRDAHQQIMESLWETLYPAMLDKPIEEEPCAYAQLTRKLDQLMLSLPTGKKTSSIANRVSGKRYELENNLYEWDACQFEFKSNHAKLLFFKGEQVFELTFGMNRWIMGVDPIYELESTSGAVWVDEHTCVIHTQIFEELQMFIWTCNFSHDYPVIHIVPVGVLMKEDHELYLNGRG